jgi:hypothetical protein
MTTMTLHTAIVHNDGGMIREILRSCPYSISQQAIENAKLSCVYMKKEHLLKYFD